MVDYNSKNVCVYQCNQHRLEAPHGFLLSLKNWFVGVDNPTKVGRGGEGRRYPIDPQLAFIILTVQHWKYTPDALWLLITFNCQWFGKAL